MHLNAALLVDYVSRHKTAEIILGKPFDQSAGSYTTERTSFGDRNDRQTAGEELKDTNDEVQASTGICQCRQGRIWGVDNGKALDTLKGMCGQL